MALVIMNKTNLFFAQIHVSQADTTLVHADLLVFP